MEALPGISSLVFAISTSGREACPPGASLNSIHAGLVRMPDGWRGLVRVVWNIPTPPMPQLTVLPPFSDKPLARGTDTLFVWRIDELAAADTLIVDAAWS